MTTLVPGRPDDWLFETLSDIKAQEVRHSAELRAEMRDGFKALSAAFEAHEGQDRKVADRVLVIETQRADEAKAAIKRGAWAGIVAAAGLTGLIQIGKALFGK